MVAAGASIYDIAREMGYSPYKLAKMYTKRVFGDTFQLLELAGNPAAVSDGRLREDLLRCCLQDPVSSQKADLMKHVTGYEYEEVLYDLLTARHMCFETESDLRRKGKPKTPGKQWNSRTNLLVSYM
jgi:hypothetical protein